MNDTNSVVDQVRNDLKSTSEAAKVLFEQGAILINDKADFSRRRMGDEGKGAVYVYYDETMQAIYVGQTSRHVKARLYDQTSPHQKKEWWQEWKVMRFLPLHIVDDRLVLEMLLIIAYAPTYNVKPGSLDINGLFADLTSTNES